MKKFSRDFREGLIKKLKTEDDWRLLATQLGLQAIRIAWGPTIEITAFNVLQEADKHGKTETQVEAAAKTVLENKDARQGTFVFKDTKAARAFAASAIQGVELEELSWKGRKVTVRAEEPIASAVRLASLAGTYGGKLEG